MGLLEKLIGKDVDALQAEAERMESMIHDYCLEKNKSFGESVGTVIYAATLFVLKRNTAAGQTATASARVIIELVPAMMKFYVEHISQQKKDAVS